MIATVILIYNGMKDNLKKKEKKHMILEQRNVLRLFCKYLSFTVKT